MTTFDKAAAERVMADHREADDIGRTCNACIDGHPCDAYRAASAYLDALALNERYRKMCRALTDELVEAGQRSHAAEARASELAAARDFWVKGYNHLNKIADECKAALARVRALADDMNHYESCEIRTIGRCDCASGSLLAVLSAAEGAPAEGPSGAIPFELRGSEDAERAEWSQRADVPVPDQPATTHEYVAGDGIEGPAAPRCGVNIARLGEWMRWCGKPAEDPVHAQRDAPNEDSGPVFSNDPRIESAALHCAVILRYTPTDDVLAAQRVAMGVLESLDVDWSEDKADYLRRLHAQRDTPAEVCTCNAADLSTYAGPLSTCEVHGPPELQDRDGYPQRAGSDGGEQR